MLSRCSTSRSPKEGGSSKRDPFISRGSRHRELIAREGGDSVRARHLRQAGWLGGPRVKLHSIGQCLVRLARLRTEIQPSENFEELLIKL